MFSNQPNNQASLFSGNPNNKSTEGSALFGNTGIFTGNYNTSYNISNNQIPINGGNDEMNISPVRSPNIQIKPNNSSKFFIFNLLNIFSCDFIFYFN